MRNFASSHAPWSPIQPVHHLQHNHNHNHQCQLRRNVVVLVAIPIFVLWLYQSRGKRVVQHQRQRQHMPKCLAKLIEHRFWVPLSQPPDIVGHEVGYSRVPPSARTTRHNIGPAFNSGVWILYDPCNFRASRAESPCKSSVVGACCIHVCQVHLERARYLYSLPVERVLGHCVS
jgi:hypothetical protein